MSRLGCQGRTHVFIEETWGATPWCYCGQVRNQAYKRSLLDRLLRRPRQPLPRPTALVQQRSARRKRTRGFLGLDGFERTSYSDADEANNYTELWERDGATILLTWTTEKTTIEGEPT